MTELQSRSGIDRRTVVRAGLATAWTVPLVQAAGAAPAFAVSGPADLSGTTGSFSRGTGTEVVVNIVVHNNGGSATQALTATISITRLQNGNVRPVPIYGVPADPPGWTRSGGGTTWTVGQPQTWTANEQLAPGANKPFQFIVHVHEDETTRTIYPVASFTTTGGTAGSVSSTLPKA